MTDFSVPSSLENTLEQAGVKGMRWGFRKNSSGGYSKSGRSIKGSKDHRRSRKIKRKRLRDMSNDEIKELNNRLQLERKYRELNPNAIRRGENLIKGVIGTGNTVNSVMTFAASPAGQRAIRLIGAKIPKK